MRGSHGTGTHLRHGHATNAVRGAGAPSVTMLLLGDVSGDVRVIKTARSLQDAGLCVTIYCLSAQAPAGALPDLHGATVRWVHARRPIARALAVARALAARRGGTPDGTVSGNTIAAPNAVGRAPRGLLRTGRAFLGTIRLNLILARAVREPGAIMHAHDLDTLLAGARLARRCGARLIYDAHELYPEMLPSASPLYAGLWRLLEHRLIGAADAVITVNDSIATELQRRHRLARRPTVIMNCPQRTPHVPAPPEMESPERIRLLYHGAFTAGRGLEALVQAMAQVDERAVLVLRGNGPLVPELRRLALDAGSAPRIEFTPPVPPDQLVAVMAGCSIGIVPYLPVSLNNYLCTPNKLFEYMMGGLAVVATDLPELRRIVRDSGCGLLYAPNDDGALARALNALIRNPDLLARCRVAARRAAEQRYNWDAQAARLQRLYASRS